MPRPANHDRVLQRMAAWREFCPNLTIRSTFIVGFQGEMEEEFSKLSQQLEEAYLDRVGRFKYEDADGTVTINNGHSIVVGDIVEVEITSSSDYDLMGRLPN